MQKIELKVSGMSCGHCEKAVVNALIDIGVETSMASHKAEVVTVEFDPEKLTIEQIKNEIIECGYEVHI